MPADNIELVLLDEPQAPRSAFLRVLKTHRGLNTSEQPQGSSPTLAATPISMGDLCRVSSAAT